MFLPQTAEQDIYDANGQQIDDVNSVIEYIAVTLGYDHTPDDEDDDNGQNFHIVKFDVYNLNQSQLNIEPLPETTNRRISNFPLLKQNISVSPFFEVPFPPPEA
jgi:hypothetical protein